MGGGGGVFVSDPQLIRAWFILYSITLSLLHFPPPSRLQVLECVAMVMMTTYFSVMVSCNVMSFYQLLKLYTWTMHIIWKYPFTPPNPPPPPPRKFKPRNIIGTFSWRKQLVLGTCRCQSSRISIPSSSAFIWRQYRRCAQWHRMFTKEPQRSKCKLVYDMKQ